MMRLAQLFLAIFLMNGSTAFGQVPNEDPLEKLKTVLEGHSKDSRLSDFATDSNFMESKGAFTTKDLAKELKKPKNHRNPSLE